MDVTDWSFDKAEALARSVGGNVDEFFPLANTAGKVLGVAGVAISGAQLYIGWAEDGWQWDQDGWNAAQVLLGVAGIAAGIAGAPWIAVAVGIGSIGIAVTHLP